MKKLGFLVLAVAVVMGSAGTASAFSLANNYQGPLQFKFNDFTVGNTYTSNSDNNTDGNLDGQADYGNANGSEDAWGIFKVTSIVASDFNSTNLWNDGNNGEELTGIFHSIDDDFWQINGADGSQNIQSVGGIIELYLDSTPDYNAAPGPGARVGDTYPTATDGNLFLQLAFVPGITYQDGDATNDHITYDNSLTGNTAPFTTRGAFYLDVIGGSHASLFNSDYWNLTDDSGNNVNRDFFGHFVADTANSGQWLVRSFDPIEGAAVPEPASMVLLGSGLLGMAGLRRKKQA